MVNKNFTRTLKEKIAAGQIIRVVIYARTSTLKDAQRDSCDNQIALAKLFLSKNKNFELVETYVDEGKSGKTNKNRDAFNNMLQRIKKGDIDLILVKTKSRLCRSKSIAVALDEMMSDYKFSIMTLSDGQIYDNSDRNSRLINAIKDAMDEDFVYGQSEYGKLTHELNCDRKKLTNKSVVHGYKWDKDKKDIVIDEEEAEHIRFLFEKTVYNDMGLMQIAREFEKIGVVGTNSGKLLTANTLTGWLNNEAYKGNFYINKRGSELKTGFDRETVRFVNDKSDWVLVERLDLAIITPEMFELAKKIREERMHVYDKPSKEASQARFKGLHTFASKIFCGSCGTPYLFSYTDRNKTIACYRDDFTRRKTDKNEVCYNIKYKKIMEETLEAISKKAINLFLANKKECIDNLMKIISETMEETVEDKIDTEKMCKQLKKLERERIEYFEGWKESPDKDMKDYFMDKICEIKEKISYIQESINKKAQFKNDKSLKEKQLEEISKRLDGFRCVNTINRDIVLNFIDKIIINEDGNILVILKFGAKYKTLQPVETYEEARQAIQNGEPVTYIKGKTQFTFFGRFVCKLFDQGMTALCQQDTPIAQKIC